MHLHLGAQVLHSGHAFRLVVQGPAVGTHGIDVGLLLAQGCARLRRVDRPAAIAPQAPESARSASRRCSTAAGMAATCAPGSVCFPSQSRKASGCRRLHSLSTAPRRRSNLDSLIQSASAYPRAWRPPRPICYRSAEHTGGAGSVLTNCLTASAMRLAVSGDAGKRLRKSTFCSEWEAPLW